VAKIWLSALLLASFNWANAQQAEFKSTACAQHEKYSRFVEARECAQTIIKHSKDSIELASAFAVLARVEDEYFSYEKGDSLFTLALSYFPKREKNTV